MRRRSLFPVLALAAALSLSSCLSPTLPLPPPEQPTTINAGTTPGTWEVFGNCNAGALVTVFNERTGEGVVVEDRALTGVYHVTIEGTECDLAWVKEDVESGETMRTSFVLAARKPGDPTDNPACH
ncbi:Hypothetical protein A7982_03799 [Minicystis rosea]|nr:Hypothetical protein A7982_03799 [Minicystis rosea]